MGLVDAEDHGLLFAKRVQLLGQFITDDLVKGRGDHAAVERLDVEAEFIFQLGYVDFAGLGVDNADRLAFLEADAVLAELGFVADRWFVIHQPVVGDCFAVAVGEYRFAENFAGVLGRGGGEADAAGVEVVEYAAVLREVLAVITHGQFAFGHFLVEGITPVGFVDDDAVELAHGRRVIRAEDAADHGLHGGDLDARFCLGGHIAQLFDVVDLRQGVVLLKRGVVERVDGLLAEGAAVNQKEDAFEAFGLQKTVHQANDGAGFTGAGGHGQ
ncbi:hypothetical protein SSTU70S_03748 [Stutzerimonas stutzeri]